ncbi:MAG: hypothetical protein O3C43_02295 [Verrucomicrobia bacterium]|nr:hypothetical protein [Verrucomicrobiota bacterium]
MKFILTSILFSALTALGAPLAKKGTPILSNPFEGSLERHESVDLKNGWTRKISFGIWTLQNDGSLKAINVPEHGHGPVLTFIALIRDIIIECEFMIPETPIKDRHFRIFIDEDGFGGHNIQSTANLSSSFRPVGFTLQHLRKDEKQGIVQDVDFGPLELNLIPGKWYKMRLEVVGDQARTTVDGITLESQHANLNVEKSKIGLNPGLAGGSIRNFKAWEVKSGS